MYKGQLEAVAGALAVAVAVAVAAPIAMSDQPRLAIQSQWIFKMKVLKMP